jgi:hypothetical protein
VDVTVVESATVVGAALALGGMAREYGLLGVISLVLLGYGGLVPGRALYLPVLGLYLGVGIILMYETRTPNLARAGSPGDQVPSPWHRPNWGYRLAHLAACCVVMLLLVASFPMPQGRSVGLVPVSFRTSQELAFPLLWRQWLQPTAGWFSRGEAAARVPGQTPDGEEVELSRDPGASRTVPAETHAASVDAREGGGGAGVGTDLVMRVQSAAKVYWLVQLYDLYDGHSWQVSSMLREGRSVLDQSLPGGARRVDQHISLVKPPGKRLPGAYRTRHCLWETAGLPGNAEVARRPVPRTDGSGSWLTGDAPEPPWEYRVFSQVPTLDAKALPQTAHGLAPHGWSYRQLPDRLISDRVRRLAAAVTEDGETPLAKAMALQEHLRQHYTYSLTPPPVPETAEPVDFFLFESRTGYSQHFAQALTVLARAAGLPARLATGYSPGNYSLLNDCFEVYEYHAHAWTQIHIEPYGWLTFDGVAPANLRIEARPAFLRQLMDPFPESWSAHPPELSVRLPSTARPTSSDLSRGSRSGPVTRALHEIYARAVRETGIRQPSFAALARAAGLLLADLSAAQWERLKAALADWVAHAAGRARAAARQAWHSLRSLSAAAYAAIGVGLCIAAGLWSHRRLALAVVATAAQRWVCRRRWCRLERLRHGEPVPLVRAGCDLLRQVMALGRFARPANLDAEEYADWLALTESRIGADYRTIAGVVHRMVYRDIPPTRADAEAVLDAVGRIRQEIIGRLSLAGTRRRASSGPRPPATADDPPPP